MASMVPSLRLVFAELDSRWPNRDRRTDGSVRTKRPGDRPSDHHPDSAGRVHAIDIDKDGIDANWVAQVLADKRLPTRYVIWNRRIAERRNGFAWKKYTGTSNPHTDHIHLSIERTDSARNFKAGWGIAKGKSGFGPAPGGTSGAPSTAWDFRAHVMSVTGWLENLSQAAHGVADGIRSLRR